MHVLTLMAHTGGGHRSVALALERALADLAPEEISTEIVDIFNLGEPTLLDRITRWYGPVSRTAPRLYGWAFHLFNQRWLYRVLAEGPGRHWVPKFEALLAESEPDVIVSTHPLGHRALVTARDRVRPHVPIVATVTELVTVHRCWVEPGIARYTVATEEARQAVCALGADPDRITRTGLPVLGRFGTITTPPATLRTRLGLDPDRATALFVGGGEGTGELDRLVAAVEEAGLDLQLIVVCGRNERLRTKLNAQTSRLPRKVFGFVDCMPELMHAADMIATKGGPQSIVEGLASGRPLVVTQTLPGQERGNAAFVERHGAGYDGRRLRRAVDALAHLTTHPGVRRTMARRAEQLAQPDAAHRIARVVREAVPDVVA